MIFRSKNGSRTRVSSLPRTCSPSELSRSEVELLPLCLSVVLPSSVLTHFEDWNLFVRILVASPPTGVKIIPFVPVERVPFIQRD